MIQPLEPLSGFFIDDLINIIHINKYVDTGKLVLPVLNEHFILDGMSRTCMVHFIEFGTIIHSVQGIMRLIAQYLNQFDTEGFFLRYWKMENNLNGNLGIKLQGYWEGIKF